MPIKDRIEANRKQRERYHLNIDKNRETLNAKARERRKLNGDLIREQQRINYAKNADKIIAKQKAKRKADPEKDKAYQKKYREELRDLTFRAYGGSCVCCGESNFLFLTIDHIYNDGYKEQKNMGMRAGVHMYRNLKKQGFPKDRYRLLCFNCNCGRSRAIDKVCPHVTARLEKKE